MGFDAYPEPDEVLGARVPLAMHKCYTFAEATRVNNRVHIFDTEDGYRLTLIKERDQLFGTVDPVLHVSMVEQPGMDVAIPETDAGRFAAVHRVLSRLGVRELIGEVAQSQSKGRAFHVWFMLPQWSDQPTHARVE